MGSERHYEDSHRRRGSTPKLSLAGQIDGVVDGRPVTLLAERKDLILTAGRLRTLLMIERRWRSIIPTLRALLTRSDIRLFARIRWLGQVEVHPNPTFLVRMLLPLR